MPTASHESVPRARLFERVAAVAAMVTVLVAGCTGKADTGSAENPAVTSSAGTASQIAGLAAMNLVFVANPNGNDQIFEQSLSAPNEPPVALTDPTCNSRNPQAYPRGKGKRLLVYYSDCAGGEQVFTLDLDSHVRRQLTYDTGVRNYDPTYVLGSDGAVKIDWKRTDPKGDYGELWEMDDDGSDAHALTSGLIAAKREAWKPTEFAVPLRICTVRERQGDPNSDELYVLDVRDGRMQQITKNNKPDWYPDYSLQQNKLVEVTKQDRHDVLATMNPDGTGQKVIVAMPGDNDDPSWVPEDDDTTSDGLVVFINDGSGPYSVYVYELATGRIVLLYDGHRYGRALAPILLSATGN